jgi:hypothetical protein
MRRLPFFLLLLTTAAAPALAQSTGDEGDRRGGHQRGGEPSEESDRRAARQSDNQQSQSSERQFGARRSERNQANEQGTTERIRAHVQEQQADREQRRQDLSTQSGNEGPAGSWRRGGRSGEDVQTQTTWQPRERRLRTIPETQPNVTATTGRGEVARTFEGRPRRDYRDGNYRRWSTHDWRSDRRYDWRRHRDRHRSIFHLGFYYDPFGWSYRRWSIGSFLWPNYYRSSYWLDDPWYYRLPPAYGPYRWVRYWDDALLVNIYTGQVVDVLHNFFW